MPLLARTEAKTLTPVYAPKQPGTDVVYEEQKLKKMQTILKDLKRMTDPSPAQLKEILGQRRRGGCTDGSASVVNNDFPMAKLAS